MTIKDLYNIVGSQLNKAATRKSDSREITVYREGYADALALVMHLLDEVDELKTQLENYEE